MRRSRPHPLAGRTALLLLYPFSLSELHGGVLVLGGTESFGLSGFRVRPCSCAAVQPGVVDPTI